MKKLLLLALLVVGGMSTVSATDYSIGSDQDGWALRGTMTDNGDGTYSYIINLPVSYDTFLFTIFEGTTIASDWSNAYRPSGSGANWGLDANNTPTMVKGANNYVLSYPVSSTIARALKVDFTPSTGACTVTRLIAVASGKNGWSTTTDYLAETSRGSNIYTGTAELEVTSANYNDGYQFVGIGSKTLKYYAYKNDNGEWIDTNQGNALVTVDGVYQLTANFENYNWVAPSLVDAKITVTDADYATLVCTYNLDFTSTYIKAYTAKVNTSTGAVVLTPINKVPANTPVVLYKAGGATENIPAAAETDTPEASDLHAGTGATVATTDGAGNYNYILNNVEDKIGFYKAAGKTVATDRAYLQTTYNVAAAGARMMMVFADDVTGIETVKGSESANGYFNLAGQRVTQPTKGLYIVNGKKVIMK